MSPRIMLLVITAALFSCNNNANIDVKAEGDKLMQTSRDWSRVSGTDSIDRILSYWADDATLITTDEPTIQGKEAIRAMLVSSFKQPGFKISWEPISATISKSGDLGYLVERNQITFPDSAGKTLTVHSRVVTIWRKNSDGTWKNIVDMASREPEEKK